MRIYTTVELSQTAKDEKHQVHGAGPPR